jgi:hypothetical protein
VTIQAPKGTDLSDAVLVVQDLSGRILERHGFRSTPFPLDVSHLHAQSVVLSVQFRNGAPILLGRLHIIH